MVQHRIDKSNPNYSIQILIQYNTHIVYGDIDTVKPYM